MKRKVTPSDFFATHPAFSLEEAAEALVPPGGHAGTVERLKHHLKTERLKLVARGLYTVVPSGVDAKRFQPDPILVAAAARSDAVFSHHRALELLGAGHSVWRQYTLYTSRERRPLSLDGNTICFFAQPRQMLSSKGKSIGTRRIERRGRLIEVTGPERTLVEGFRRPKLVGGLEELIVSSSGFPTLDLDLLKEILQRYKTTYLWAATGWFLERFQQSFHVPEVFLKRMEQHRPGSPHYLERESRGGKFVARWNVIVPHGLVHLGEPDER